MLSIELKKLKEKRNLSTSALAQGAGIPNQTLQNILCGKTDNPTLKTLESLAHFFDLSITELIEGPENIRFTRESDEMMLLKDYHALSPIAKSQAQSFISSLTQQDQTDPDACDFIELPHYDFPVSAGTGAALDGDAFELRQYPALLVPHKATFTLRVRGDSMIPDYLDDDIVFVSPEKSLENGDIGVIIINDEGFIKEFRDWSFISKNPAYPPIHPSVFDQVQIVGKVLGKLSAWKKNK